MFIDCKGKQKTQIHQTNLRFLNIFNLLSRISKHFAVFKCDLQLRVLAVEVVL